MDQLGAIGEAVSEVLADLAERSAVERLDLGEVQVQNFGSSRDVLIRVPVREGVRQEDVGDAPGGGAVPLREGRERLKTRLGGVIS